VTRPQCTQLGTVKRRRISHQSVLVGLPATEALTVAHAIIAAHQ
jgi:hypothetical protein